MLHGTFLAALRILGLIRELKAFKFELELDTLYDKNDDEQSVQPLENSFHTFCDN